jgi:DNA-binding response OmpR family regulator
MGERAEALLIRSVGRARRPRRPQLAVEALGRRRAAIVTGGDRIELSPRHSEIVALLGLHPEGLTSRELARELYGPGGNRVTVRAEISRLRRQLGPLLAGNPYRLDAEVRAEREELQRVLQPPCNPHPQRDTPSRGR